MNARDVADLPELMRLQARCHLDQVGLLEAQIKELEKALHPRLVPDADVQRLLRVPGVGKVGAFTLKLEIDDVTRFPSDRAFFSYCRLVPGADNSGERTKHRRSREGNRYLKIAFSHATVRAIQHYPEVKEWYRRKRRKKPEAVARALVAKEIARIVYHVLRKGEDFNGRFKGVTLSRVKQEQWPLLPSPASITDSDGGPIVEGRPTAPDCLLREWEGSRGTTRSQPPKQIWDGSDACLEPAAAAADRARVGVWPATLRESVGGDL